jgi:hypothetical protein
LTLNFPLDKFLDYCYRIECAVDVDVLERVRLEHEGDSLLLGNDEDDV